MARFAGKVGFVAIKETVPGVYEEVVTERTYYGDTLSNYRNLQSTDQVNDNINISKKVSIMADPFARDNFHFIRYVVTDGAKWKAVTAEPAYPRIILTLGGVYNG
jgi:hypothetical protein